MKLLDALILESEAKVNAINQKQGDKVWSMYQNDIDDPNYRGEVDFNNSHQLITWIDRINDKYTQWVVNMYVNGNITLDQIESIGEIYKQFEKYKRFIDKKDINQYKTYDELYVTIVTASSNDPSSKREKEKLENEKYFALGIAKIFYQDSNIKVVIPYTKEASCYFGKGTKWCTAGENDNRFDEYNRTGPLYIIMPKGEQKYQLWFSDSSVQFMDSLDKQIDQEEIDRLDSKYHVKKIFAKLVKEHNYYPMIENPTIYDFVVYYEKVIADLDTNSSYKQMLYDLSNLKFKGKQYTDIELYDEFMETYNRTSDVKHLIKFLFLISKSITSKLLDVLVEDDVIDKADLAKDIIQFYKPENSGMGNAHIDEYLYTNDLRGTIKYYHKYLFTDEDLNNEFQKNPKLFAEMITDNRGYINNVVLTPIVMKLEPHTVDKIVSVMDINQVLGTSMLRHASKKVRKEYLTDFPVQVLKVLTNLNEFSSTEKLEIMDNAFEKATNLTQILTITNNYAADINVENIDTIFQNRWITERDYLKIIEHFRQMIYKFNDPETMLFRAFANIPTKFLSDNIKRIQNVLSGSRLEGQVMKHIDDRIKNS